MSRKEYFNRLDCERILELMARIETHHKACFHDVYPDLDEECRKALDGETTAIFVINKLNKIVDEINGVES